MKMSMENWWNDRPRKADALGGGDGDGRTLTMPLATAQISYGLRGGPGIKTKINLHATLKVSSDFTVYFLPFHQNDQSGNNVQENNRCFF